MIDRFDLMSSTQKVLYTIFILLLFVFMVAAILYTIKIMFTESTLLMCGKAIVMWASVGVTILFISVF